MCFKIDLSDRTAVITGVSSGIGAGIAKMFARAGANIAGCALESRNYKGVKDFFETIKKESAKEPLYIQTDVTDLDQLDVFVSRVVEKFKSIDILASNAGTNVFKGAENCSRSDWLYNLNLNLESHWNISRLCKPHLEQNKNGVILINSSCHAFNTLPGSFPYNIAKSGLKALVQSLTLEWSPGIRTVGIAPGFIETQLAIDWFNSHDNPEVARQNTVQSFPLRRLGTPEEIGGWFVFLSSSYASFAGGQTYLIDGGRSAVMFDQ